MKIKSIYYFSEPKNLDSDVIHVRILTEPEKGEGGGYEYALEATTMRFIDEWMKKHKPSYYVSSIVPILVVQRLDDETIRQAIENILPNIDNIASRVE